MNAIAQFRLCTLSDSELIEKVNEMTDKLFFTKAKHRKVVRAEVLARHVPARPNSDYDLLIGELLIRFKELSEKE